MDDLLRTEQFQKAVEKAWIQHNLGTYGMAERKTGLERTLLLRMRRRKEIPTRGKVIEWAEGIGEDINKWLELAGYDPIPPELVKEERAGHLTKNEIIAHLRTSGKLSEKAIKQVEALIEEVEEAHQSGKPHIHKERKVE